MISTNIDCPAVSSIGGHCPAEQQLFNVFEWKAGAGDDPHTGHGRFRVPPSSSSRGREYLCTTSEILPFGKVLTYLPRKTAWSKSGDLREGEGGICTLQKEGFGSVNEAVYVSCRAFASGSSNCLFVLLPRPRLACRRRRRRLTECLSELSRTMAAWPLPASMSLSAYSNCLIL